MSSTAALLIPALRWEASHGFDYLRDAIDDALEIGVGGFLIRGGPREAVAALTADLHKRSSIPLLIAADAERGAGEQFDGALGLPPLAALAALNDPDVMRRAARITANELKQMGLNWALAPVCDLDVAPGNPIVGVRSAGSDPSAVAELITAWIDACQHEGVLACAKHFPGHGHATEDSHRTLPTVRERAAQLWNDDIFPFRAAADAGVASIMTAHVAFKSLDPSGLPATLSRPILTDLLRGEMEFDGLIATDALEMDGILAAGTETEIAVRAIAAGCDVLIAPTDIEGCAKSLDRALSSGALTQDRLRDALERRTRWAVWAKPAENDDKNAARPTTIDDTMWARQAADRSVTMIRGTRPTIGEAVEVIELDEDANGLWTPPNRAFFADTLRALGVDATVVPTPTGNTRVPILIAAYSDVIAWKPFSGFSQNSSMAIELILSTAKVHKRHVTVILFSHPRHATQLASAPNILGAWSTDRQMQESAARSLVRGS